MSVKFGGAYHYVFRNGHGGFLNRAQKNEAIELMMKDARAKGQNMQPVIGSLYLHPSLNIQNPHEILHQLEDVYVVDDAQGRDATLYQQLRDAVEAAEDTFWHSWNISKIKKANVDRKTAQIDLTKATLGYAEQSRRNPLRIVTVNPLSYDIKTSPDTLF